MKKINQGWLCFSCAFILTVLVACATIPYLELDYRLPNKSEALNGKRVFLAVEDARTTKDMIGKGAQEDFEHFSGNVSLSVGRGSGAGTKMGVYEVPALFKEAFAKRLENEGVEAISVSEKGVAELTITVQKFLLDLVDRRWTLQMAYEARLSKDGKVLSRQIVSGEGERMKLIGREQADIVVGEVFTDLVNRVNLIKLFREAEL